MYAAACMPLQEFFDRIVFDMDPDNDIEAEYRAVKQDKLYAWKATRMIARRDLEVGLDGDEQGDAPWYCNLLSSKRGDVHPHDLDMHTNAQMMDICASVCKSKS